MRKRCGQTRDPARRDVVGYIENRDGNRHERAADKAEQQVEQDLPDRPFHEQNLPRKIQIIQQNPEAI